MIDFNMEYYRAFYYVAQLQSISKAAKAMFLTQPAVTHSIQMMENHFNCKLFIRSSKGMKMTNEGKVLYEHVVRAFDELISGENKIQWMRSCDLGHLEIGATETALYQFLLPKIESFHREHPNVHVHIAGSSTPETLKMIKTDMVNLAVAVSPVEDTDNFKIIKLCDFQDIFIAGTEYSELMDKIITPKQICKYPLAVVEKGTSARQHIDLWFNEQGLLFNPEYSVRTSSLILPFVERNLAIGIIPQMFAQEAIQKGHIFQVHTDREIPCRQIVIIYKDSIQISLLCKNFIQHLLSDRN